MIYNDFATGARRRTGNTFHYRTHSRSTRTHVDDVILYYLCGVGTRYYKFIYRVAVADNDDVLTKRRNVAIDVKTGPHSCACRELRPTLSSGRVAESHCFLLRHRVRPSVRPSVRV